MSQHVPWWWYADPAPDFLKLLKEEDIRIIAGMQIDSQIASLDRQVTGLKLQMEDLAAKRAQLAQLKNMVGRR
jgi:hypothetical protein